LPIAELIRLNESKESAEPALARFSQSHKEGITCGTLTANLQTRVTFFRQVPPTSNRIRLTKYGVLPKSYISLWKVAKVLHFLRHFFASSVIFYAPT
jgi:hypothetical protein